jgi:hypothetical protein
MSITLAKAFAAYVVERELPRTADARIFELIFLFRVEGTLHTGARRYEWRYFGTQEAIDQRAGKDGLSERHRQAVEAFERSILRELQSRGQRLYSQEGETMPILGEADGAMTGAP